MYRFFLTDYPIIVNHSVNLTSLVHQLRNVLRLAPGAQIVLLDNSGHEFDVTITELHVNMARGDVLTQRANSAEPTIQLTLYQCSLKADKFEWVLQKGTELGVSRFVPVISERSIVRPATALFKKYERWRTILREAAEQCGRGRIPELLEPLDWRAATVHAEGVRLFPWEKADDGTPYLFNPAIQHALHESQYGSLLIGPEGGISMHEAEEARKHGWQMVSLGPRILRAETAALVAVTLRKPKITVLGKSSKRRKS